MSQDWQLNLCDESSLGLVGRSFYLISGCNCFILNLKALLVVVSIKSEYQITIHTKLEEGHE